MNEQDLTIELRLLGIRKDKEGFELLTEGVTEEAANQHLKCHTVNFKIEEREETGVFFYEEEGTAEIYGPKKQIRNLLKGLGYSTP